MANFSTYFIKNKDNLMSKSESIVIGNKYRFTVLTERLIRLEYSDIGAFENRATNLVVSRDFEKPSFSYSETEMLIQINTNYFTLNYVKNKPFGSSKLTPGNNLKVVLKESDKEWYYGHPEARNFGGPNYSLEGDNFKLGKGLYSTDGFCVLDDSNSLILNDKDEFVERENKEIDLYLFMYKKDFGLCLNDYYRLTGYPNMIPRYALGNWWYKNDAYSIDNVKDIVNKFDDNEIPLSIFLLGNKWHNEKEKYEFDDVLLKKNELISFLKEKDIKLGLTINPEFGIDETSVKYNELTKYFPNEKIINFIPFSMNKLGLYFNMFIRPLENDGVTFFNIDYNNIKDRNNLWMLNHYHLVNANITKNIRGLVLSRNSMIAPHRYPIMWTGKTKVSWETLNMLPLYNLSASNMGVSWIAHALGGYYGGIEDSELYLRYIQFGTFSPIFVLASEKGKYYKREPWKWNALNLSVIKDYMELRHRLIPYIYSEGKHYCDTGLPLTLPFYYSYPKIYDEPLYKNQYFFGREMFISPITKKKNVVMNRVVQRIFVPDGIWYDFQTGKKFPGNKYYVSFYKDEDYPVFCKSGSIIPLSNDNSTNNPKNMEIVVFPGTDNKYELYEDDGITNKYLDNESSLTEFDYKYSSNNYVLSIKSHCNCENMPDIRNYKIRFKNTKLPNNVNVILNKKSMIIKPIVEKTDLILEINDVPINSELVINIAGDSLEVEASIKIYEDIAGIIDDLEVTTLLKEKIDAILFSDLSIRKKRIEIKKLKRIGLEPKFVKMFINLLEYISEV